MYWTMSTFEVPGPPPLSDWIIANSFIAPIVPSRITRNEVGRSNGHAMRRNRVTGPAPSSEAASRQEAGMFRMAALNSSIEEAVPAQDPGRITTRRAGLGSAGQLTGSRPAEVIT